MGTNFYIRAAHKSELIAKTNYYRASAFRPCRARYSFGISVRLSVCLSTAVLCLNEWTSRHTFWRSDRGYHSGFFFEPHRVYRIPMGDPLGKLCHTPTGYRRGAHLPS